MKCCLAALGLITDLVLCAAASPCHTENNTVYSCPAKCFCEPTYEDFQDLDGLRYSDKYDLLLHLFQPPHQDTRAKRPAMVMIHGGGFKSGDRTKAGIIDWCKELAMRGYVAVSIDYRLDKPQSPGAFEKANLDAMYDARAAVRWLRKNAELYRVDPDRIGAFGSSAGAMTVAFMTTVGGEGQSGNAGFSSDISVGVSLSGALLPDPGLSNVSAGQPPFLDFHGCADCTVPYSAQSGCGIESEVFNGLDTVAAMQRAGRTAGLYSFPGKGHVPWKSLHTEPAANAMLGFLAQHLNLTHAECPP